MTPDDLPLSAAGGFVPGAGVQMDVVRVGDCPNGHPWFRIDGSPYVEHVARADEMGVLDCPYRVHYAPTEETA